MEKYIWHTAHKTIVFADSVRLCLDWHGLLLYDGHAGSSAAAAAAAAARGEEM
tara:strand:+ start:17 stop:175 length:159 start_codon:yes stop_codon:yes gene_type:complete